MIALPWHTADMSEMKRPYRDRGEEEVVVGRKKEAQEEQERKKRRE